MGRLLSCWLVVFEVMPEERDWLLERRIVKSEMGVGINDEPNRGAFVLLPGNPHIDPHQRPSSAGGQGGEHTAIRWRDRNMEGGRPRHYQGGSGFLGDSCPRKNT